MFDLDPRDYDRDDARQDHDLDRLDRDDDHRPDWGDRLDDERDRDEERRDDRDRYGRDRDRDTRDPRDVFMRDLDLPRGHEREIVRDRDREHKLRGSESRTLSTVGSFRVVMARDLRDHDNRPADARQGDLRHLRESQLVDVVRMDGRRDAAVVLTREGRRVLESHRRHHTRGRQQEYYAGLKKPRELEHDAHVYRAYLKVAERLRERDARIERVALDYELKRDYQRWLHYRDRERDDYDGHPDRTAREIAEWAHDHDLPYYDNQVHFPDLRIEYRELDGRADHEDVEVTTLHYRGGHGAAASKSGFTCFRASSARCRGGSSFDPDLARDFV
jgi:hypothetical protein